MCSVPLEPPDLPPHIWEELATKSEARAEQLRVKVAEMRASKKADRLTKQIADMEYAILSAENDARNMRRWAAGAMIFEVLKPPE